MESRVGLEGEDKYLFGGRMEGRLRVGQIIVGAGGISGKEFLR